MDPLHFQRLLDYWIAVEVLTPGDLPSQRDFRNKEDYREIAIDRELPWPYIPAPSYEAFFTVYLGVASKADVAKEITTTFGAELGIEERPPKGRMATAALVLDAQGVYVPDSFVLSSSAWALGQLHQGTYDFHLFPNDEREITHRFDEKARENKESRKLENLLMGAKWIAEAIGWSPSSTDQPLAVTVRTVRKNDSRYPKEPPRPELLNSFYLRDLITLRTNGPEKLNAGLRRYLSSADQSRRLDVLEKQEILNELLAPERTPPARWPGKGLFPLALMQQAAVNTTFHQLENDPGLFSINGPPGTGKTTLLRDLVAGIVHKRAEILARIKEPERAFKQSRSIQIGQRSRCIRLFPPELLNHEIVVASSNNNAVENVTNEIPAANSVDSSFLENLSYFRNTANELLREDDSPQPTGQEEPLAWGLVAGVLGKAENKGRFVSRFWFNKECGMRTLLRQPAPPREEWRAVCRTFQTSVASETEHRNRVIQLREDLDKIEPLQRELAGLRNEEDILKKNIQAAELNLQNAKEHRVETEASLTDLHKDLVAEAEQALRNAVRNREAAEASLDEIDQDQITHVKRAFRLTLRRRGTAEKSLLELDKDYDRSLIRKPGWIARTLHLQAWREWSKEVACIEDACRRARGAVAKAREEEAAAEATLAKTHHARRQRQREIKEQAKNREDNARRELAQAHRIREDRRQSVRKQALEQENTAQQELTRTRQALASHRQTIRQQERLLEEITARSNARRQELGDAVMGAEFWDLPEYRRETTLPWVSEEHNTVRAELFTEAFAVHEVFIRRAANILRGNLETAVDLLIGTVKPETLGDLLPHVWASLFLVVPVISTTFAAGARMFQGVGREQLGWLLVDEAGQAIPQAAVGAIWRAKRTVVIGDPLQIPPVLSLPTGVVKTLNKHYGIPPEWDVTTTSTQILADRANPLGTMLDCTWLGMPLRVHRRCEAPMFGLSNRIAYDGFMIQATGKASSPIGKILGDSTWFDVRGSGAGGDHWIPQEGKRLRELIKLLRTSGFQKPDLFIISPFKRVASQIISRRLLPEDNVGTIHTFQGREAEAVILVLGGTNNGARAWAGCEPNILNVAATRAKRRLYVIGDAAAWERAGVFSELVSDLPVIRLGSGI